MNRVVYLKTTEACNLSCKHCFTGGSTPPRYFWKEEMLKDWIYRLRTYIPEDDFIHFELHGGEPMLAPMDSIHRVVDHIRNLRVNVNSNISLGITTNLVYKLNDTKIDLLANKMDSIGTSWDPDIRFKNSNQLKRWKDNVKIIRESTNKPFTLFISVSKVLTDMDQEEILTLVKELGFNALHFERITQNGNALEHQYLFPTNEEIQEWYLKLHKASEKLNAREWFNNTTLEGVYSKFENAMSNCGTFCRDCEEKLFTVNANGSIAGCPNSAPTDVYGHITQDINKLFNSSRRVDTIIKERIRNPICYTCPVFKYCGSDCYKLDWQGEVCPAPRKLMIELDKIKQIEVERKLKEIKQNPQIYKMRDITHKGCSNAK